MNTFGERIAYLREKRGVSQAELAKHFKIAKSTLGMYETNKREPSFEMAHRIADYFDVSVDWLTGRVETRREIKKEEAEANERIYDQEDPEIISEFERIYNKLPEEEKKVVLGMMELLLKKHDIE